MNVNDERATLLGQVATRDPSGRGLQVEFLQLADRVAHRIKLLGPAFPVEGALWLTSSEGWPALAWPPSPPLQNLHLEERENGQRIALLVGLAGRSHWSLSVEPLAGEAAVRFDVACRVSSEPEALGSKYLVATPDLPAVLRAEQFARVLPSLDDSGIIIQPESAITNAKLPRTIRWIYVARYS